MLISRLAEDASSSNSVDDADGQHPFWHGLYWLGVVSCIGYVYSVSTVKDDFVIWAISFGAAYFLCPIGKQPARVSTDSRGASSGADTRSRPRLYYLDNLKVFLTGLVVVHHITCGFSQGGADGLNLGGFPGRDWFRAGCAALLGLDQSYFMVLFMFLSGYFTPQSYDRKGQFLFLQDKFKRLALPLLFWVFALNPLLVLFLQRGVAQNASFAEYHNGMGPPWFIKALLMYNVCYALAGGTEAVKMPLPGFWTVAGLTTLAQVIEVVRAIVGLNNLVGFAGVPFSSGAAQALAFYGGCVAYRNCWLDALLEMKDDQRYRCRTYIRACVAMLVLVLAGLAVYWAPGASGRRLVGGPGGVALVSSAWIALILAMGIANASLNFAMLDFFGRFLGKTSRLSKFLASAAYTVYLIHPFVWNLALWSYVKILQASGFTLAFDMVGDVPTNRAQLPLGALAAGWLYTVLVSQLTIWPLAWSIAKLPILNQIL